MTPPPSSLPRVGLIGVSGYASTYLQLALELHDAGHLRLSTAVVINPAEEAPALAALAQRRVTVYADYRTMLAAHRQALELCLIPTGIPWHTRMTLAALEAGANVLVEKPLAGSLADVRAIRQAEKASGRFVAVGFQDLYTPEVMRLKTDLCRGIIGPLTSIRLLGLWPRPGEYYTRNDWAGRLQAQGAAVFDSPLNNAFAHYVNLCLFLAGAEPTSSSRAAMHSAELLRAHAIESFDTAVVQATLAGGLPLWIGLSHACSLAHDPEIVLEGTRGRVRWRHDGECEICPTDRPVVRVPVQKNHASRRTMFLRVVERLQHPEVFVCGTDLAEAHATLVDEVHARAEIHQVAPGHIDQLPPAPAAAVGPVVRGLAQALQECFANRTSLFATHHCPAIAELRPGRRGGAR